MQLFAYEKQHIIGGKVTHNGTGVPFVVVYQKYTSNGVSTDENGVFQIGCYGSLPLVLGARGLGYSTSYFEISDSCLLENVVLEIDQDYILLEQVVVSGSRIGLLRYLPGTASSISKATIDQINPINGNEVLRTIPGLHVVEEEGAGLRANIGIRGLDPDKSRNVLILEDGIPLALAPYGEPEMYFTPSMDRMSGVEVLKGNGSILFGPQTIGGVINYLTADPPDEASGKLRVQAGEEGFYNTQLFLGNSYDNLGFTMNFQRKQARNFGPTSFLFHDLNLKLNSGLNANSEVSLKLGVYDETSNSTYVGLTQPMYASGKMDDLRIAPDDHLHVRRYSFSALHNLRLSRGIRISTTAFAYTTVRNWNRQDFTYNPDASNLTGTSWGYADQKEGAIFLRNSTGLRNRQFEVAGIEPRVKYHFVLLDNMSVSTEAGVRFLYERAFEQRLVGSIAGYSSGNLRDDEIRTGKALSMFAQNTLHLNQRISVTAGLRSENVWYHREIMRLQFADTLIQAETIAFALIPEAGVNYNITENLGLFFGVHKGFAPPRTKDAISSKGEDMQLEAEKSWNTEVGARLSLGEFQLDYTMFRMDFSNQIIPVSESSGGLGTGYMNGGKTLHAGMELSLVFPFLHSMEKSWSSWLSVGSTWVNSRFSNNRYVLSKVSEDEQTPNVYESVKGNKTPYAPQLSFSASFTLENHRGWGLRISTNYTGSQYTDALNTRDVYEWIQKDNLDDEYNYVQATANGRIGKMDAYMVANLSMWYTHSPTGLGVGFSIKNLLNERYIVTRRPQGIRAGLPRFLSAEINYAF